MLSILCLLLVVMVVVGLVLVVVGVVMIVIVVVPVIDDVVVVYSAVEFVCLLEICLKIFLVMFDPSSSIATPR